MPLDWLRVVTTAGSRCLIPPEQLIRVVVPSDGLMNRDGYLFLRHGVPSSSTIVSFGMNPTPLTCSTKFPPDTLTTLQLISLGKGRSTLGDVTHVNVTS